MRSMHLLCAAAWLAAAVPAVAQAPASTSPPSPDPRIGLKAGLFDAGTAAWNMRLVSTMPRPKQLADSADPGDFGFINSDLAFKGHFVIQGNFHGIQVWDVIQPSHPILVTSFICPEAQNDVSVYRNLLFVSSEDFNGRIDCGTQGIQDSVSKDRFRGVRVFDISNITNPKSLANVQTCRGSHTHTLVTSPADTDNLYIYVSGGAPVRSPNELAGCSALAPDKDPNSELFRIEVIQVPLAHPEQAHVVSKPPILADLAAPTAHGAAAQDIAESAREADSARAHGGFTYAVDGMQFIAGPRGVTMLLDSIVKARGATGTPTATDTTTLRDSIQIIVDRIVAAQRSGPKTGPVQCHDITVYPALGIAGGACAGYGVILDIRDPANPKRIAAAADSNFAFWHSATFSNDGSKVLFTDEWGGGLQPKCRATDKPEWGADALFTLNATHDTMTFQGYYKMPAAQTSNENCVAHNGSLIPVPGRAIMAQGWYQGGVSVFDWTDPAHPKEIAFFDRGPVDSTKLVGAGSWALYWYNGLLYSSELARGLDIYELQPSAWLTQNEIDAAKSVHVDYLNVQDQQQIVWPASFAVARAYVDQLARGKGLSVTRIAAIRGALTRAEGLSGAARQRVLTQLGTQLQRDATAASDKVRVTALAGVVGDLAKAAL